MAESAEVTVRKASIISLCQADTNYSQHGGSVIHHIDTLHQFKRFLNVNGHAQPVYAQAFIQSDPAMDACDTDTTDDAPVSDILCCIKHRHNSNRWSVDLILSLLNCQLIFIHYLILGNHLPPVSPVRCPCIPAIADIVAGFTEMLHTVTCLGLATVTRIMRIIRYRNTVPVTAPVTI
jgi:hypothetical protein